MLHARANGETFVSGTMCPQQCVLDCQGLKRDDISKLCTWKFFPLRCRIQILEKLCSAQMKISDCVYGCTIAGVAGEALWRAVEEKAVNAIYMVIPFALIM